jgi:tungstate transport system substrate-binding protein
MRSAIGAFLAATLVAACAGGERPLRIGTTYTVEQSGALALLDSLHPPTQPAVVVGPSGQILAAAARGDLDIVVTHAPSLEARLLVDPGHARLRCPFVASAFAVLGPAADPAGVAGAGSAADAFLRIARRRAPFVSRGDSSGTHVKELALWRAAGVDPRGAPWYLESGADQTTAIHLAEERGGYALADLPTAARLPDLTLRVLFSHDTALVNRYTLYVLHVSPPHAAADTFAAWALGSWRARLTALRLPDGSPAFQPATGGCATPTPAVSP